MANHREPNQGPYPDWILYRLESLFNVPPRFENSFYGPINGVLSAFFNPARRFMVKPQAILLPNYPITSSIYPPPGTNPHPDASRSSSRIAEATAKAAQFGSTSHNRTGSSASTDSFGDNTLPRNDGAIKRVLIPDFIVVKANQVRNNDVALVLVEVKLDGSDLATSINQVKVYLDRLQTKNYADKFVAFLCMGPFTYVWTTSGQGNNRMQTMLPLSQRVRTGSADFCQFMVPVRMEYW